MVAGAMLRDHFPQPLFGGAHRRVLGSHQEPRPRGMKKKSPSSCPADLIALNSGTWLKLLRAAPALTRSCTCANKAGVERIPEFEPSTSRNARANTESPWPPVSSTGRSPPDASSRRVRFGSLYLT